MILGEAVRKLTEAGFEGRQDFNFQCHHCGREKEQKVSSKIRLCRDCDGALCWDCFHGNYHYCHRR